MSFLHHPDDVKAPDILVWNNAAFDNEESDGSASIKTFSSSKMQDMYINQSFESLQTDCGKENLCPLLLKTPASVKYSVPVMPLNPNGVIGNSQGKPLKIPAKVSAKMYGAREKEDEEVVSKDRNIDAAIKETEEEINRLSTRLKALQFEKAEQNARTIQRCGSIVPVKLIELKKSSKVSGGTKVIEDTFVESKINHRGKSLGASEICAGVGSRRQEKVEVTPVQQLQSRRKSCLPKLQDIEEEKVTKRRGNSMSLSPKPWRTSSKVLQGVKQPAATAVSKRSVRKAGVLEFIQPKKLFKDVEKSVPASAKKPLRTGRIVASRYNLKNENSAVATESSKRSVPGNFKDEGSRYDKRRASSELSRSKGPESRVKKRWEIPSKVIVYQQELEDKYVSSVAKVVDMLPKIRTTHYATQSPRDSGPAKRVAELIDGRKNIFAAEEMGASICLELNFTEEEE